MGATKVKILLSIAFLAAGAIAYGLLVLRHDKDVNLESNTQAPIPLTIPDSTREIPLAVQTSSTPQLEPGWKKFVLETADCAIPTVPLWSKALQESWQEFDAPSCTDRQGIVSYIKDQVK